MFAANAVASGAMMFCSTLRDNISLKNTYALIDHTLNLSGIVLKIMRVHTKMPYLKNSSIVSEVTLQNKIEI